MNILSRTESVIYDSASPITQKNDALEYVRRLAAERTELFKAAELMACFLTNVNTINEETTKRLIEHLKNANCEGLADAIATGGFASMTGEES